MSSCRGPVVALAFSLLCVPAFSQSPPQRDPRAVALLNQSLAVMGGPALATVADTKSEVTTRSFAGGEKIAESSGVQKTLGRGAWRIEAPNAVNGAGTIANGDWVFSQGEDGEKSEYPVISVAEAGNWRVPWLSIIGDANDPDVDVTYIGLENDGKVHRIRLYRQRKGTAFEEITKPCDVLLDAQTGLPAALMFSMHPPSNLKISIPATVEYANYQAFSGVLVPTSIKFSIRGQLVTELTVSRFWVNLGISAAEFQLR